MAWACPLAHTAAQAAGLGQLWGSWQPPASATAGTGRRPGLPRARAGATERCAQVPGPPGCHSSTTGRWPVGCGGYLACPSRGLAGTGRRPGPPRPRLEAPVAVYPGPGTPGVPQQHHRPVACGLWWLPGVPQPWPGWHRPEAWPAEAAAGGTCGRVPRAWHARGATAAPQAGGLWAVVATRRAPAVGLAGTGRRPGLPRPRLEARGVALGAGADA